MKRIDDSRPNIILIMTDQQRYDTIGALGYPHMDTPNLDKLVNEGITFGHSFVTAPSCAPCRSSLFTGMYVHTTGVFNNNKDTWPRNIVSDFADYVYH